MHIPFLVVLCPCQMTSGQCQRAFLGCTSAFHRKTKEKEREWLLPSSHPSMAQGRACRTHQAQELTRILGSHSAEIACYETAIVQFPRHHLGTGSGPLSWWPHSLLT